MSIWLFSSHQNSYWSPSAPLFSGGNINEVDKWVCQFELPNGVKDVMRRSPTEQRTKTEHEITLDKQREDLLQTYLDRMSELLLKEKLRSSEVDAEVRNVARVRTITVLNQLDVRRIGYVFPFLLETGLMSTASNDNVVSLSHADFHTVNWSKAYLREAYLRKADLREADLRFANLREAHLREAHLSSADLREANLWNANLRGANLRKANLSGADLREADLREADLSDVIGITVEKLEKQAKSLQGATMPDGSIHP